jgi:hypothetical protein
MDDRALAISILERAREILAARLAERIIEAGDEIIDDALGQSYSSEIEGIHDQIGLRLTHVNAMLNSLPPTAARNFLSAARDAAPGQAEGEAIPPGELPEPLAGPYSEGAATDAARQATMPAEGGATEAATAGAASFQSFIKQIMAGDVDAAGETLAALLDVQRDRGRRCAATFAQRLAAQPDFLAKAMRLRGELQSGSINGSLMLLWECFGLQGMESIGAMQALKKWLADRTSDPGTGVGGQGESAER